MSIEQLMANAPKRSGLEDSLQFYVFESFTTGGIPTTNIQERIHKDVCRPTRVVGIIRSDDSYLRLATSYLIKYAEDWATNKRMSAQELSRSMRSK